MTDSLEQVPIKPSSPIPKINPLLIIGLVAIILFSVLYYLKLIQIQLPAKLSTLSTTPTATPSITQTLTSADLENCQLKKQGNPLIDNLTKLADGTVVGTFRGNINNVSIASNSAQIELVSPKADQIHNFTVKQEKGLVFDAINLKELTLTDLKRGQTLVISFNCFPKNSPDKQFKITRIAITSKR